MAQGEEIMSAISYVSTLTPLHNEMTLRRFVLRLGLALFVLLMIVICEIGLLVNSGRTAAEAVLIATGTMEQPDLANLGF